MGPNPDVRVQQLDSQFQQIGHTSFLTFPELYLFFGMCHIAYRVACPLLFRRAAELTTHDPGAGTILNWFQLKDVVSCEALPARSQMTSRDGKGEQHNAYPTNLVRLGSFSVGMRLLSAK